MANAGHHVTLAITGAERKSYAPLAEKLGFRLMQAGHIWNDDEDLLKKSLKIFGAANQLAQLNLLLGDMFQPCVEDMYRVARLLCAENDFLIGHFLVHPLQLAAEISRKPHITVTLNHSLVPTGLTPPDHIPNLGPLFNPVLWKIAFMVLNRSILPSINNLRAAAGVAAVRSFRDVWESRLGNLIAVSPAFFTPDPAMEKHHRVCGFLSMPENAHAWEMPASLARFLADGPPPVYMTFGSMASVERDAGLITASARLLADAAKTAGCRAIIQANWDKVSGIPDTPAVYRIASAPHTRIFPRCAAVVHHGGSGTTQTALSCGRPSIVVAHILDQYFWGNELKRLGVGAGPFDRRTTSPEKLGREICRMLDAPETAARADALGRQLRAENGVATAVNIIERTLAKALPRI